MSADLVLIRHPNSSLINDILAARKNKAFADMLIEKKHKEIEDFNLGQLDAFNKLRDRAAQRWQVEIVERFKNVTLNCSKKYRALPKYETLTPNFLDIDPLTGEPRAITVPTGEFILPVVSFLGSTVIVSGGEYIDGWYNYMYGVYYHNPVNENGWLTKESPAEKAVEEFFLPQFKHDTKPFPDEVDAINIGAKFTIENGSVTLSTKNDYSSALNAIKTQINPIYYDYLSDAILCEPSFNLQTGIKKYKYTVFLDINKFDYAMTAYFLEHHINYSVETYVPHDDFREFLATAVEVLSYFAAFAAVIMTVGAFLEFAAAASATTTTTGAAAIGTAEATAAGMDSALIANTGFWANVQIHGFSGALEILGAETLGSYAGYIYKVLGSGGLQFVGVLSGIGSLYSAYSAINRFASILANGLSDGLPDTISTTLTKQNDQDIDADDSYDTLFLTDSDPDDYDIDRWIKRQLEPIR